MLNIIKLNIIYFYKNKKADLASMLPLIIFVIALVLIIGFILVNKENIFSAQKAVDGVGGGFD